MDFTLKTYRQLLDSLQNAGFSFLTFEQYLASQLPKAKSQKPTANRQPPTAILRHDVDLLPQNSLATAQIEHELGIKGSYYFRIVPESNQPEYIEKIRDLGHEIGYHYEDLTLCKGNMDEAIKSFEKNLAYFRQFYPVQTICMHGSPRSPWDSKDLWKHYHYRDFGITGEPYFDVDFNQVFYLTDTGRRWDGWKVSVRDKVPQQEEWVKQGLVFKSTGDIIQAAQETNLPNKIMITVHPQRWTDKPLPWLKEWALQKVKNVAKYLIVSRKL